MKTWIVVCIIALISASFGMLIGINGFPLGGFLLVVFAFFILFSFDPLKIWIRKLLK
jgi:hypothetical protein